LGWSLKSRQFTPRHPKDLLYLINGFVLSNNNSVCVQPPLLIELEDQQELQTSMSICPHGIIHTVLEITNGIRMDSRLSFYFCGQVQGYHEATRCISMLKGPSVLLSETKVTPPPPKV
jgi:hypothetical protein